MPKETLLSLAERVEKASGPDKALDLDIHEALGNCVHRETEYYAVQSDTGFTCKACHKDMYGAKDAPRFTASLDAAMTLVPEGWRTAMVSEAEHIKKWEWRLGAKHGHPRWGKAPAIGFAATPALALASACLKALASEASR